MVHMSVAATCTEPRCSSVRPVEAAAPGCVWRAAWSALETDKFTSYREKRLLFVTKIGNYFLKNYDHRPLMLLLQVSS
jgi:hypothetical protein